jgi:beta-galactosidase
MKNILSNLLFVVVMFSFGKTNAQIRTKINFGTDWEFKREEITTSNWEKVTIPHTAKIEPLVVTNFKETAGIKKILLLPILKTKKSFCILKV